MLNYLYGAATFYALGAILLLTIVEPADPDRPYSAIWFSLLWPFIALTAIFETIIYGGQGRDD